MPTTFRSRAAATYLVAIAVTVTAATAQVRAQVTEPFKIRGTGVGPKGLPLPGQAPRPHFAAGEATHLGRYTGAGTLETDSAEFDPTTGTIVGEFSSASPFVFTGANGDKLACWYGRTDHGADDPGQFELTILGFAADGSPVVQAVWVAEFVAVPTASTGRFAGVTGGWVMTARSAPFVLGSDDPVAYSWDGDGELTFRRGR